MDSARGLASWVGLSLVVLRRHPASRLQNACADGTNAGNHADARVRDGSSCVERSLWMSKYYSK